MWYCSRQARDAQIPEPRVTTVTPPKRSGGDRGRVQVILFSIYAARYSGAMSSAEDLAIRVECYAGHRGEETPRRFFLGSRPVEVIEVVDRWLAPAYRYFKVRGDDDAIYILRHDVAMGRWELTMFDRRR